MCSSPWPHPSHGPVKCGQCMECRLAYSREWAIRITHEQQLHEQSCFLTLTYDDGHLPAFGQLFKRDLQLFFKRARKAGWRFRYVACGEYGETRRRPHFHVALFGRDFREDRLLYSTSDNGPLFTSSALSQVWTGGMSVIGELTFESAAYIARYITKRLSGPGVSPLPLGIDPETGEVVFPNPEFLLCSRRPGIGSGWFDKYFVSDVLPHGRVITSQGTPAPVPRFYKEKLRNPWFSNMGNPLNRDKSGLMYLTAEHQESQVEKNAVENTAVRRSARTIYAAARTGLFKRDLKDS